MTKASTNGRSARIGTLLTLVLLLTACKGGTSDFIPDPAENDRDILPEGELIGCFNPGLYATGTTFTASYFVRRYEPTFGFYGVAFGITETREVIGAASFNGVDNAVQIRVSSLGEDIGAPSIVPLTNEPDSFTGEFMAYYAVDLPAGEVRYLGAERDKGDGYVLWELADPHEALAFDLEPGESVEQTFTLTTNGVSRTKDTVWTYQGQGSIDVPAGSIDACQVSGTGHEPSLFVPTPRTVVGAETAFEIFFAQGTGIPVYVEYTDDTSFPLDPVMEMRLIEAFIDGERVH